MLPTTLLNQLEQNLYNADQPSHFVAVRESITPLVTSLAFAPEELLDLSYYGLVPMLNLSSQQEVLKPVETTLPLLRNKRIQWRMVWQESQSLKVLFVKLGTGGRVNHCQLVLSIFDSHTNLVTSATLDGSTVIDGQWTALVLNQPLASGQYVGELTSPDADNQVNTLFLWVTMREWTDEISSITHNVIDLYRQGLTPIMALSMPTSLHRSLELAWPIWRGKLVQWYVEVVTPLAPLSTLFLKFATEGKTKQGQLVLSLFKAEFKSKSEFLTLATRTIIDGSTVREEEWTAIPLNPPLSAGRYVARLTALHSNTSDNPLLLCLTVLGLEKYCYVSPVSSPWQRWLSLVKPRPQLSIIIPITVSETVWVTPDLSACLTSVVQQNYPVWELCVVTDHPALFQPSLDTYQREYPHQIQLLHSSSPASSLNQALQTITGEYLVILWPTDLLAPTALSDVVKSLNQTTIDWLYSDEDKINEGDIYNEPHFKPDWSPELLRGYFYTGQLGVYRTKLVKNLGGFRPEFYHAPPTTPRWPLFDPLIPLPTNGYETQLWEMTLRLSEQTPRIQHLPKVLYHQRRQWPFSDAIAASDSLCPHLLQATLNREGHGGQVIPNPISNHLHLWRYPVRGQPLVSIIIPTKDQATLLTTCLESLRQFTDYSSWEIIIVDNGSQEDATFVLFEHYQTLLGNAFQVIRQEIPFNFSKLVNAGVAAARGEIILLLNNDTELLGPPDWLSQMLGFAQQPAIAGVGGKLLYPQDQTIQHAGLICGIAGIANHSHKHAPAHSLGYFNRLAVIANYSAITGACLMVRRELWERVQGFDEYLGIAFNDVDFCLKLLTAGYRHVVLPQILFHHHESKSRGLENTVVKQQRLVKEEAYMRRRWGQLLKRDPYYNPHLTHGAEDFSIELTSIYCCETRFPKPSGFRKPQQDK